MVDESVMQIMYFARRNLSIKSKYKSFRFFEKAFGISRISLKRDYEMYENSAFRRDIEKAKTNADKIRILSKNFMDLINVMSDSDEIDLELAFSSNLEIVKLADRITKGIKKQ